MINDRNICKVALVLFFVIFSACHKSDDKAASIVPDRSADLAKNDETQATLQLARSRAFTNTIKPLIDRSCHHCHASPLASSTLDTLTTNSVIVWDDATKSRLYLSAIGVSHPRVLTPDMNEAVAIQKWINGDLSFLAQDSHPELNDVFADSKNFVVQTTSNSNTQVTNNSGPIILDRAYFEQNLKGKFATCNTCHAPFITTYLSAVKFAQTNTLLGFVRGVWQPGDASFLALNQWLKGSKITPSKPISPGSNAGSNHDDQFSRSDYDTFIAPALNKVCSSCHHNPVETFERAVQMSVAGHPEQSRLYIFARSGLGTKASQSIELKQLAQWISGEKVEKDPGSNAPVEPKGQLSAVFYNNMLLKPLTTNCGLCHEPTQVDTFEHAQKLATYGKPDDSTLVKAALGKLNITPKDLAEQDLQLHPAIFKTEDFLMQKLNMWILGAQTMDDTIAVNPGTLDKKYFEHQIAGSIDRWCTLCHAADPADYSFDKISAKVTAGDPENSLFYNLVQGKTVTIGDHDLLHPTVWDSESRELWILREWIRGAY